MLSFEMLLLRGPTQSTSCVPVQVSTSSFDWDDQPAALLGAFAQKLFEPLNGFGFVFGRSEQRGGSFVVKSNNAPWTCVPRSHSREARSNEIETVPTRARTSRERLASSPLPLRDDSRREAQTRSRGGTSGRLRCRLTARQFVVDEVAVLLREQNVEAPDFPVHKSRLVKAP
jgi:hypothetical protein